MENIGNGFIVVEKSGNYEKFSQEDSEHFYKTSRDNRADLRKTCAFPWGGRFDSMRL